MPARESLASKSSRRFDAAKCDLAPGCSVAEAQIRRIAEWWRVNRPAAPGLFARELAHALEAVTAAPLHRILLRRSRYHVYFSYDAAADIVAVRAVWHAVRGVGPPLH